MSSHSFHFRLTDSVSFIIHGNRFQDIRPYIFELVQSFCRVDGFSCFHVFLLSSFFDFSCSFCFLRRKKVVHDVVLIICLEETPEASCLDFPTYKFRAAIVFLILKFFSRRLQRLAYAITTFLASYSNTVIPSHIPNFKQTRLLRKLITSKRFCLGKNTKGPFL